MEKRTVYVAGLKVTYFVMIGVCAISKNLSVSSPHASALFPMLRWEHEDLLALLELFGFRYRPSMTPGPSLPSDDHWVEPSRFPTLHVSELVGETDTAFVERVLGDLSRLVLSSSPTTIN